MINLKKKIASNKCAAMRCKLPPAEIHHLDEDLPFCESHAQEARKEYGDELPIITVLGESAEQKALVEAGTDAESLQAERQELEEALTLVRAFEIVSQEDVTFAEEERASAKGQWKEYEEQRKKATKPMNEALKEVNSWFKPVQTTLKSIEGEWTKKLKDFRLEQLQKQEELQSAAKLAAESGDMEATREALVAAAEAPIQTTSTTFVERWVFEIIDESLIPREYLMPDEKKIGGVVAAMKEDTNIPGIVAKNDPILRGPSR